MFDISNLIQTGIVNPWLYLPAALLLGALHALEPGHSKSLMAAFIVAIRGTPAQAVLLGVSAAIGHTIIVWGLALLGLYLGDKLILEKAEPWLVLLSGVLIILLALRLLWSLRSSRSVKKPAPTASKRDNAHGSHSHGSHSHGSHALSHAGLSPDAHAAAHEREIENQFAGRQNVSNWEIGWFGFTGGLLPCPAAIAVLLVCLHLKAFGLGIAMVAAFSLGLAITLVAVGVVAAWGTRRAAQSWSGFDVWARRIPYASGALVMALGLFITFRGLAELGILQL